MEKIIKKYGVVILFYIVVIIGVSLLSARLRYLQLQHDITAEKVVAINK